MNNTSNTANEIRELNMEEVEAVQGGLSLVGNVLGLIGLGADVDAEAGLSLLGINLGLDV